MTLNNEKISICVISDPTEIDIIEHEWNSLVDASCSNPFLLSDFVKELFELPPKSWSPHILVMSFNETVVGIAPLVIRKKFGVRTAKFSNPYWGSDFIINSKFKELCVAHFVDFLFKTLNCNCVYLILSTDSPNYSPLMNYCKSQKLDIKTFPEMGRRIIPITSTWDEFAAGLGRQYEKKLKKNELKLNDAGSWTTVCVNGKDDPDVINKILEVEKKSWKANIQAQGGDGTDRELTVILRALQSLSKTPNFDWNVYFIELDGTPIAYCITIDSNGFGFLLKTSYDEQYKKFYPGFFLQDVIVRDMYKTGGRIRQIDFLSDLRYQKTWAKECVLRTRITLSKGILVRCIKFFSKISFIQKIVHRLL